MPTNYSPKSHFFTNPLAITQVATQVYGPVNDDEFRLTSLFTLSANTPAYAICAGIVFIQPQIGSASKVNLILRPFKQPVQGFNIRYFVYRGLKRSDFFDGNNIKAVSTTTTDFINKINEDFTSYYTNTVPTQPLPVFLAKYIGFDPTTQTNLDQPLDDFFFKQTQYIQTNAEFEEEISNNFELPLIQMGKTLGNFATGDCGIDVVLNYGDYKLPTPHSEFMFTLQYAQLAEAKIDTTTETNAVKKKIKKEHIYQFLDIAAFYGHHHCNNGWVITDNAGVKQKQKGDDIYTQIVSRFATKTKLYLYIQSDRGRSYNFYGNYNIATNSNNALKIGNSPTTLIEVPFETNTWPLLVLDSLQTHSENNNKQYLQLVTDNNPNSLFYGQIAEVQNAQGNNFINADNLRLSSNSNGEASIFTSTIILSNPAISQAGSKLNVANFNILLYQGKTYSYVAGQFTNNQNIVSDILAQPNFFDDVFEHINATPLVASNPITPFYSISYQKIKLINQYYNKQQQGIAAVQTSTITDEIETNLPASPTLKRVTYITEAVDVLNNAFGLSAGIGSPPTEPPLMGSVTGSNAYKLPNPFYCSLKPFTDSTQTVIGLTLKTLNNKTPDKIILGITHAENNLLKALITTHNLSNATLFLVDLFEDGNQLIATENILYQKYSLGIVGEQATGELKLYQPSPIINVYSLDRNYHFTKGYSEYVKEEPSLSLALDLEITL